ncbi:hypothetical protein [Acidovorax sp. SUPP3334]|uniref:hypothetical protein n=1 Tax=Acidovorax sp. SUPP3334 TaxID=2920881 RepID=UPI0023DE5DB2|nr:hypothetical protein [Acidovorax sp. SUPP3334]GKT22847.1 hypothetical protein AVHM3334_09735 [Acidovorax sp. SUPP3334]
MIEPAQDGPYPTPFATKSLPEKADEIRRLPGDFSVVGHPATAGRDGASRKIKTNV